MSILLGLVVIAALILVLILVLLVGFTAFTAKRVEAALPPRGSFKEIDGQLLHYVDTGATGAVKPAIVMIHGLGGNMLNLMYGLAEKLSGDYRVILIDRPGSGYSRRPAHAPATLSAQAATIAKLIRVLHIGKPLIVGHSLGGALALTLALQQPDCVGGLALIAPLTHAREEVPEVFKSLAIVSPALRRLIAWTLATPMSIMRGKTVLDFVFAPDKPPADFPFRGGGLLGLRPSAFYASSSDMVAINDDLPALMQRYGTLAVPFGMIFGKGDRILDYREQGEAMRAKVPSLELTLIEGGHMIPISQPDQTASMIRQVAARVVA
jgi:pimeloyl-ACP methyl ester carboxylesterase